MVFDPNDEESRKAALTIQSNYRGYAARRDLRSQKADTTNEVSANEPTFDFDMNDPETIKAATSIQAGFKGYKARKDLRDRHVQQESGATEESKGEEEEIDIDLNDPEVEKAAIKIQAGFQGFKARKEIQSRKDQLKSQDDDQWEVIAMETSKW